MTAKAELRLKGGFSFGLSFVIAYCAMRYLFDYTGNVPFLAGMFWAQISEVLTVAYAIGDKLGAK